MYTLCLNGQVWVSYLSLWVSCRFHFENYYLNVLAHRLPVRVGRQSCSSNRDLMPREGVNEYLTHDTPVLKGPTTDN